MRCANLVFVWIAHHDFWDGLHNICWRIPPLPFVRCGIDFDQLCVVGTIRKVIDNGVDVRLEAFRRDLKLLRSRRTPKISDESVGILVRAATEQMCQHELRMAINGDEAIGVTDFEVVRFPRPLVGFFFLYESPDFITLYVPARIAATPGYFAAIGMTLLAGRTFTQQDSQPDSPLVAMVNETVARHFWRNGNPVGRRIRYPGKRDWYQVVGLLRDEKHDGLDQHAQPSVFLPYSTAIVTADPNDYRSLRLMTIVVRSTVFPEAIAGPAREIVRQLDPEVPMYDIQTVTARLAQSLWARRAYSWLFSAFAAIAILLAAAGVYGVVSYTVSQRTQEMGIRAALGAQPAQLLRHVLLGGMALVSTGAAAGLLGALWATTLMRALLADVRPRDPVIYGSVAIGVISVGLLANFIPARRAAAADPMLALRFD
jgi:hypothetical protein